MLVAALACAEPNVFRETYHRHGRRGHSHRNERPHRDVTMPRRSARWLERDHHENRHVDAESDGHSDGVVDERIKRRGTGFARARFAWRTGFAAPRRRRCSSRAGVSFAGRLVHNFGDALTALPLGVAFALRSEVAERRAGLAVVAAIFISACVADVEAVNRLVHPVAPSHLLVLGLAGVIGYVGNYLAAHIRLAAGRRLTAPR